MPLRARTLFMPASLVALLASVCLGQPKAIYEPGPILMDPRDIVGDIRFPPHRVAIAWLGDSYVNQLARPESRVPSAAALAWDFSASEAGTIASESVSPRFFRVDGPTRGQRLAQYAGSTPVIADPDAPIDGEVLPTVSRLDWELFPDATGTGEPGVGLEKNAVPLESHLSVRGTSIAAPGPQLRSLGMQLDPTDRDTGFNPFIPAGAEQRVHLLAYISDEVSMFDGIVHLVDEGDEDDAPVVLDGERDIAFNQGDAGEARLVWRAAPESETFDGSGSLAQPGGLNATATALPVVRERADGSYMLGLRHASAPGFTTSGQYLSWWGVTRVLYGGSGPDAEPLDGPRWLALGSASYSYRDVGGGVSTGDKSFSTEQLAEMYFRTRIDPDPAVPPSRDIIFFAAEGRNSTQSDLEQAANTVIEARIAAGYEDVGVIFLMPHAATKCDDTDATVWQRHNDDRDAMLEAAATLNAQLDSRGKPKKVAVVSLYDYTQGIIFDGRQEAIDFLDQRYGPDMVIGDSRAIDVAALSGDLLDPNCGLHPNNPGGILFADMAWRAMGNADNARCPADLTGPGGDGVPNGELSADDFFFYLALFADADPDADLTGPGGDGVPNGALTADDFFFYLGLFADGCR